MMNRPRRHSQGFSLVELLVVLTVIALLTVLTMPMIRSGIASARQAHCMAGLRQLQMANQAYAADNEGNYVPVFSNNDKGQRTPWHNNRAYTTLLGCPESIPARVPPEIRCTVEDVSGMVGWGYNFTGLSGGINTPGFVRGVRQSQLPRSAETIAFIDSLDWQVHRSAAGKYVGNEDKITHATAYRHGDQQRANAVFWDGHAESLRMEELEGNRRLWDMLEVNP